MTILGLTLTAAMGPRVEAQTTLPPLSCGTPSYGALEQGDLDFYRDGTRADFFTFTVPVTTRVTLSLRPTGGAFAPYVIVGRLSGQAFIQVADGPSPLTVALASGTYVIGANNFFPVPSGTYPYPYELNADCESLEQQSVEEFWEDPTEISLDDNDTFIGANRDRRDHPSLGLDDLPAAQIDAPVTGERVIHGLSGLRWGGYSAAHSGTHGINLYNRENPFGTAAVADAFLRNSFLSFDRHSAAAAGDFPQPYNEQTGSYAYTIFEANPGIIPTMNARNGVLKIALSHDQNILAAERNLQFRFLIQTEGAKWYRSNPQFARNINLFSNPFGGSDSDGMTRRQREGLMTVYSILEMTWERVSPEAEANMNRLDDGGETALGATQPDAGPNLQQVTGMGALIDTLAEGYTMGAVPNNVAILGMMIEGAPPNDDCFEALLINALASNPPLLDTSGATTEPDDPTLSCGSLANPQQGHSVWYVFRAPQAGLVQIDTIGSSYDTVLGVFTGTCGAFTQIACNNDDGDSQQSRISDLAVAAGETIFIEVASFGSTPGGDLDFNFAFVPLSVGQIRCGEPVLGTLDSSDVDFYGDGTRAEFYRMRLDEPSFLTLDVRATTIGREFEGYVRVMRTDGTLVFENATPVTSNLPIPPGDYLVLANNFQPLPAGQYPYELTVTCSPPQAIDCNTVLKGQLEPSDQDLFGDGTFADSISFSIHDTPTFVQFDLIPTGASFAPFLFFIDVNNLIDPQTGFAPFGGLSPRSSVLNPGDYLIVANNFDVLPDGIYPYDLVMSCKPALPIQCGQTLQGALETGDLDFFGDETFADPYFLNLTEPRQVRFDMRLLGAPFDAFILVYDFETGSVLFGGPPPQSGNLPLPAGSYIIIVNNFEPIPPGSYPYEISLSCAQPLEIGCGQTARGELAAGDLDPRAIGGRADAYAFRLVEQTNITFTLTPDQPGSFAARIEILDSTGVPIAEGASPLTANVAPGAYMALATSAGPLSGGAAGYSFSLDCLTPSGLALLAEEDFTGIDFLTDPRGWVGAVLAGNAEVSLGAGLCMTVPEAGDNIAIWVSPEQYVPLVDQEVYRARMAMYASETRADSVPLWSLIFDNYQSNGFGNNYGGEMYFLDVDGGANGIGRQNGGSVFEAWMTPNAAMTDAWRGVVDFANSAFAPAADSANDLRVIFRTLDLESAPINAIMDRGTICVERLQIAGFPIPALLVEEAVFNAPIRSDSYAALVNHPVFGPQETSKALIDDTLGIARYQLATPSDHRSLFPATPDQTTAGFYPITWVADQLYRGQMRIYSEASATVDPLDAIMLCMDTANAEIGIMSVSTRGSSGSMPLAASPRPIGATTGEGQPYVVFFHSGNGTLSSLPDADRFRLRADFFNTVEIAPDGTGTDPFAVDDVLVERVTAP